MRVLSLGAGVQSSTLALMAEHGEIDMPDCAIFADTQSEPKEVMEWLDYLETKVSFPIHRVTKGSLYKESLILRTSKKHGGTVMATKIPAYVKNPDGSRGIFGRKCTTDYKVKVIEKKVKELLGINRFNKNRPVMCEQLIGISVDEADREKSSIRSEIRNVYPLLDLGMTRQDCQDWMRKKGYPQPPKSACTFCPFHSDEMWIELKDSDDWPAIVEFERELQRLAAMDNVTRGIPFLHPSLIPIDQVIFKQRQKKHKLHQLNMFRNECYGMCGV